MATKNIMIVGVGGQGTLLTSRILGGLAIAGGYDVEINTLAADVNADGYVTSKDVTNLRKFIAGGYGVVLLRGLERFTVKFETGGGTKLEDQIVLEGTLISTNEDYNGQQNRQRLSEEVLFCF